MKYLHSVVLAFFLISTTESFALFFDPLPEPENVKVSILTVGIGSGLERRFGHTILRVTDNKSGEEYLLNWGTFDFSQPYFVPRFLKGLLRYFVSDSTFDRTIRYYGEYEKRGVVEDTLVLTTKQKERLLNILQKRLEPENIYYWYDFFYNNCSTIPRDILNEVLGGNILKHFEKVPATINLRAYVRRDLNEWSIVAFFLDMMMNSDVDGNINAWVEMFHPIMLQRYLSELPQYDDSGNAISNTKLLTEHHTVVVGEEHARSPLSFFVCFFIIGMLALGSVVFLKYRRSPLANRVLGSCCIAWGAFAGFTGTVFLAGWLLSNHHMTHHNANLLLMWPVDFALIYLGLHILRGLPISWKRWKLFLYAHLLTLVAFVGLYFLGVIAQDVSNVLYYLAPIATVLFTLLVL